MTVDTGSQTESVQQRVRQLSLPDAIRLARSGSLTERMALERVFGKLVWEALIANPSLSTPEAARIAGMGMLPQPLLDQIVGNASFVASEEVRRRLVVNPRLRGRNLQRVLRAMPANELKQIAERPGLPHGAREAARRMMKG